MTKTSNREPFVNIVALHLKQRIESLTESFVGRDWLLERFDGFLRQDGERYLVFTGEPGIGKSAFAAHLTRIRKVHAFHFCEAKVGWSIDPQSFVRTLRGQLIHNLPEFGSDLLKQEKTQVEINPDIQIGTMYGGSVTAVNINELIVQKDSAAEAFQRLVGGPLVRWARSHQDQQAVLLVDDLNEAIQADYPLTILGLIAMTSVWPSNIRWVLTSRPGPHLNVLNAVQVMISDALEENTNDVRTHVSNILGGLVFQKALRAQGLSTITLVEDLVQRADGNFLYLHYVLAELRDKAFREEPILIDMLPVGLDKVYRALLQRAVSNRDDLWRMVYRPIIGVLVAAYEGLTFEELKNFSGVSAQAVNDAINDLGEFLNLSLATDPPRHLLYHSSFAEFLTDRERSVDYWIDTSDYHARIATYYLDRATRWDEIDPYGSKFLVTHLIKVSRFEDVYALVEDAQWIKAKFIDTPWIDSLVQDLHIASRVEAKGSIQKWLRSIGYQLCRALIEELMSYISEDAILFLAKLGYIDLALDFGRRSAFHRYTVLREIFKIVAPINPAKAFSIITRDLIPWEDEQGPLSQRKSNLAAARLILDYIPSYSKQAYVLIDEAKVADSGPAQSEWTAYQVDWLLPTMAHSGDLNTALESTVDYEPVVNAQALNKISRELPMSDSAQKLQLAEKALAILEDLEPSPEVLREKMKVSVTLLSLLEDERQESLLTSLEQIGLQLQSMADAGNADWIQQWTLQRVAPINPEWTRRILLESEWVAAYFSNGREFLLEVARDDAEEALRLLHNHFAARIGKSETVAEIIGIVALRDIDQAEGLVDEYAQELRDKEQKARLAIAEAYLNQGNWGRAEEIFNEHGISVESIETEGIVNSRCELQFAILRYAAEFISPEQAQSRLMDFPAASMCRKNEQEANLVLARIAAHQGDLRFLQQHIHTEKAKIQAAYALSDYVSPRVARDFAASEHIRPFTEVGAKLDAHIAVAEAKTDSKKLASFLTHLGTKVRTITSARIWSNFPERLMRLLRMSLSNLKRQ
jgi:hypothetical protein